jgi:LacI family transcriptional regulator
VALDEILAHQPKPTAIFAMSDSAALGLMARAQARGLKIPSDLSVIGCADDASALATVPRLTTIHLPAEEMAQAGVQEIDRLVREGAPDAPRKINVPVRLIARASTEARRK